MTVLLSIVTLTFQNIATQSWRPYNLFASHLFINKRLDLHTVSWSLFIRHTLAHNVFFALWVYHKIQNYDGDFESEKYSVAVIGIVVKIDDF